MHDDTRVTTLGRDPHRHHGIVNPPVYHASTILYPTLDALEAPRTPDGYYYGRYGTPTTRALTDAVASLEGAAAGFAVSSGKNAITTVMLGLTRAGDHILVTDNSYQPTRDTASRVMARFGVEVTFFDPGIGAGIAGLMRPNTRLVFVESPGSLTFEVQDVPAICAAAKARGVTTLIDNTWATPLLFPAIGHGVDISILACTKYIVGHSDAMLGSVTANADHWPALRGTSYALGQHVGPDDAWLGARGLRTLAVRMERHQASALAVAEWLAGQADVASVLHPALPGCPGHEIWRRDFSGSSGLFAFTLAGGDDAARSALIDGLDLFGIGFSWGGYESLVIPADPGGIRTATRWSAEGPLVRLQIGLEDPADLIGDLAAGLDCFRAARG